MFDVDMLFTGGSPSQMVAFVIEKCPQIADEFCALLCDKHLLTDVNYWGNLWGFANSECSMEKLHADSVLSVLSIACDFNRRLVSTCEKFPHQLAWLIESPADVSCLDRRRLAAHLLAIRTSADVDDDVTTLKIALMFEGELRTCSQA